MFFLLSYKPPVMMADRLGTMVEWWRQGYLCWEHYDKAQKRVTPLSDLEGGTALFAEVGRTPGSCPANPATPMHHTNFPCADTGLVQLAECACVASDRSPAAEDQCRAAAIGGAGKCRSWEEDR